MSNVLPIIDVFSELLFEIRNVWYDKSFEKLQLIILDAQQILQRKICLVHGWEIPQNDQNSAQI